METHPSAIVPLCVVMDGRRVGLTCHRCPDSQFSLSLLELQAGSEHLIRVTATRASLQDLDPRVSDLGSTVVLAMAHDLTKALLLNPPAVSWFLAIFQTLSLLSANSVSP